MLYTIKKYSIVLLLPLVIFSSGCNPIGTAAPFIISKIIVIGKELATNVVAVFVADMIDKGFRAIFGDAADNTAEALSNKIKPIDGKGLFGRMIENPQYKVLGEHKNGTPIEHTITVPTEEVLFQRADVYSKWTLTPDSRDEVARRLETASAQVSLRDHGYKPGRVDGIEGDKTSLALSKFQKDNALPVTGNLDDVTREYLLRR
ncbi:MAG: peptidoglycan-binding domain-containing protein [Saprospiraceae bacterium]